MRIAPFFRPAAVAAVIPLLFLGAALGDGQAVAGTYARAHGDNQALTRTLKVKSTVSVVGSRRVKLKRRVKAKTKAKARARARARAKAKARAKTKTKTKAKVKVASKAPFVIRRAEATGSVVPFTVRLRSSGDTAPSDDQLSLTFDDSSEAWPLAGTTPASSVATLEGALSYQMDFGADVSGYGTLGTVETDIGGGVAMTSGGFAIAASATPGCASRLVATAMSLTSAGMRFGTVNLYNHAADGTISLRLSVRTQRQNCDGSPDGPSMLSVADVADPPVPVPFSGLFTIAPAVTADGRLRFGTLVVSAPGRTSFGRIAACSDPTASDGCGRLAFPARLSLSSLDAELLLGDSMPPAPPMP